MDANIDHERACCWQHAGDDRRGRIDDDTQGKENEARAHEKRHADRKADQGLLDVR